MCIDFLVCSGGFEGTRRQGCWDVYVLTYVGIGRHSTIHTLERTTSGVCLKTFRKKARPSFTTLMPADTAPDRNLLRPLTVFATKRFVFPNSSLFSAIHQKSFFSTDHYFSWTTTRKKTRCVFKGLTSAYNEQGLPDGVFSNQKVG
jgi:hypothetical protein